MYKKLHRYGKCLTICIMLEYIVLLSSLLFLFGSWMEIKGIPVIDEGYYFFYDRHDQAKDRYDDSDLFGRPSFNFTFAVYDTKENKLYICKFNT